MFPLCLEPRPRPAFNTMPCVVKRPHRVLRMTVRLRTEITPRTPDNAGSPYGMVARAISRSGACVRRVARRNTAGEACQSDYLGRCSLQHVRRCLRDLSYASFQSFRSNFPPDSAEERGRYRRSLREVVESRALMQPKCRSMRAMIAFDARSMEFSRLTSQD